MALLISSNSSERPDGFKEFSTLGTWEALTDVPPSYE